MKSFVDCKCYVQKYKVKVCLEARGGVVKSKNSSDTSLKSPGLNKILFDFDVHLTLYLQRLIYNLISYFYVF